MSPRQASRHHALQPQVRTGLAPSPPHPSLCCGHACARPQVNPCAFASPGISCAGGESSAIVKGFVRWVAGSGMCRLCAAGVHPQTACSVMRAVARCAWPCFQDKVTCVQACKDLQGIAGVVGDSESAHPPAPCCGCCAAGVHAAAAAYVDAGDVLLRVCGAAVAAGSTAQRSATGTG